MFSVLLIAAFAQSELFLQRNCVACHQGKTAPMGLNFTQLDPGFANRETLSRWVCIHDAVSSGSMPPKPPANYDKSAFLQALSHRIEQFESSQNAN
ncbi:MAG: hypothetical protein FJW36_25125 [Acidobacteria bacterium]|nr:hypothetical protein [Acidobacteriota bacterium]